MDQPNITLPPWLPWATTACLAALVACLGELWIIERERSQFARDEAELAQTSLKAAQNELEAERIVSRREIEDLRAGTFSAGRVPVLLAGPHGAGKGGPAAFGLGVPDPENGALTLWFFNLPALPEGRDYQAWVGGRNCGIVRPGGNGSASVAVHGPDPGAGQPVRFLLTEGNKGGEATVDAAVAGGSIILASPAGRPKS